MLNADQVPSALAAVDRSGPAVADATTKLFQYLLEKCNDLDHRVKTLEKGKVGASEVSVDV